MHLRRRSRSTVRTLAVCLFAGAVWSCNSTTAAPQLPGPEPGELAILFIGNSLTYWNDMPLILERLLEDDSPTGPVYVEAVAFANAGLEDHWDDGRARDRILGEDWDFVVMQQGPSATEGRPSLLEYSDRFAALIRQAGAVPAMYMVWPASDRPFDFDGVSDSYSTAARQIGGALFPAGEAWRAAWEQDPTLSLYSLDGFHPTLLGSYLVALSMYARITGLDPRDLPAFIPTGRGSVSLTPERAAAVQTGALEADERFGLSPVPDP